MTFQNFSSESSFQQLGWFTTNVTPLKLPDNDLERNIWQNLLLGTPTLKVEHIFLLSSHSQGTSCSLQKLKKFSQ